MFCIVHWSAGLADTELPLAVIGQQVHRFDECLPGSEDRTMSSAHLLAWQDALEADRLKAVPN